MKNLPSVVLIGRINVGKSSLFNRITDGGHALVSSTPGTTRDYNIAPVNWRSSAFFAVDTGGVDIEILKNSIHSLINNKKLPPSDEIDMAIVKQTKQALAKADHILLVMDAKTGIMPDDKLLAKTLKLLDKPLTLVVNKADNQKYRAEASEFYTLGFDQVFAVSAASGSGVGDLLDHLTDVFGAKAKSKQFVTLSRTDSVKIAIIGKPNVGKSSLVNAILGEQRVIVSPVAHTTREPQHTELLYKEKKLTIIDTAGLRKKAKIEFGLERFATRKTRSVIEKSDVVALVTDVSAGLSKQDSYLAGLIKDSKKGVLIVANKWDELTDLDDKSNSSFNDYYRRTFPFLTFAPLIFTSAKNGKNIDNVLDTILQINQNRSTIIPSEELHYLLKSLLARHRPTQAKGSSRPTLLSLEQSNSNPPEFIVSVKARDTIHFSYIRFIENQLRENFDFTGVPITIHIKRISQ